MVSRFAQIVNAFLHRTFGEQSFLRCRRHDRHDTRDETDASCIFRILRNMNLSLARHIFPRIASSCIRINYPTYLASSRRVAAHTAAEGRIKNIVVDPPSRRMCAKRVLQSGEELLPPTVVDKHYVRSHACKRTT